MEATANVFQDIEPDQAERLSERLSHILETEGLESLKRRLADDFDGDKLFNTEQAAGLLGVEPRSLEARRYRGGGPPYIKIGHLVRYRRSDLTKWLDEQTVRHTASQESSD